VLYILQLVVGVLSEVNLFRRFIDDTIWMATARISNEHIRQTLRQIASEFAHCGLELAFNQTFTVDH